MNLRIRHIVPSSYVMSTPTRLLCKLQPSIIEIIFNMRRCCSETEEKSVYTRLQQVLSSSRRMKRMNERLCSLTVKFCKNVGGFVDRGAEGAEVVSAETGEDVGLDRNNDSHESDQSSHKLGGGEEKLHRRPRRNTGYRRTGSMTVTRSIIIIVCWCWNLTVTGSIMVWWCWICTKLTENDQCEREKQWNVRFTYQNGEIGQQNRRSEGGGSARNWRLWRLRWELLGFRGVGWRRWTMISATWNRA